MGKDESEMVALKEEPGYGGTDAEESKIDISDFKPAAPTWVLDGSLRAKEQKKFDHIQKIIAAFYSATRGGLMVFRSLFAILDRRGIVHVDHNETCDRCPRAARGFASLKIPP